MIVYQLSRPAAYLRISHPEKWRFDWLVPVIFTALVMAIMIPMMGSINIYGSNGLVDRAGAFVQVLPGFFIAALAAIATFNRHDVDQHMPEPTPSIKVQVSGHQNEILLTRRRFLCLLFAFLTAESILLAILSIAAVTVAVPYSNMVSDTVGFYSAIAFLVVYIFLFAQMIVATFLGLYYLGDRLHQPDQ